MCCSERIGIYCGTSYHQLSVCATYTALRLCGRGALVAHKRKRGGDGNRHHIPLDDSLATIDFQASIDLLKNDFVRSGIFGAIILNDSCISGISSLSP